MNAARITLVDLDALYPEGPVADAIEEELQLTLPVIRGMDEAHSAEQRLLAYQREIVDQRAAFVELYGEPFGWERRQSPRDEVAGIGARTARPLALLS